MSLSSNINPIPTRVSVVIPVLNEEASLPQCLDSLGPPSDGFEVVVVDGGSTDLSRTVATRAGARLLCSEGRGRAVQLQLGAGSARGDVLLFLHADTRLPVGWLDAVLDVLDHERAILGGAFKRRFGGNSIWLHLTCVVADWRGLIWGCFLGDQAMFIRRSVFEALGGFRFLDSCEDLDLSFRLAAVGRTCLLSPPVYSSARRFDRRGPVRQTFRDLVTGLRFVAEQAPASALPKNFHSDPFSNPVL